jgi:SAM-dependent methyltransferase
MALSLLGKCNHGLGVVDFGSGYGLLGPMLSLLRSDVVTEVDPDVNFLARRGPLNDYLRVVQAREIELVRESIQSFRSEKKYGAVFSISVLEHLEPAEELLAWDKFNDCLLPGGLLFVTFDCMEEAKPMGSYPFDDCRKTRFTPEVMQYRVNLMRSKGYEPLGEPDYEFHGNQIENSYTFGCIGMRKGKE